MMPPRMLTRRSGAPRDQVVADEGLFSPSECARVLGVESLNYRQFDELLALVRPVDPDRRRGQPARLTFRELVALRTAFELSGGADALRDGRNLRYAPVVKACRRLREVYGISEPLVEIHMEREGRRIIAVVDGVRFDANSGQVVLQLRDRGRSGDLLLHTATARKLRSASAGRVIVRGVGRDCALKVRMEP